MADIINTAMEVTGCVVCSSFWRISCDEFLSHVLCTLTYKCVTWMQSMQCVVMHSGFYELGGRKIDESLTKETLKVAAYCWITLTEYG